MRGQPPRHGVSDVEIQNQVLLLGVAGAAHRSTRTLGAANRCHLQDSACCCFRCGVADRCFWTSINHKTSHVDLATSFSTFLGLPFLLDVELGRCTFVGRCHPSVNNRRAALSACRLFGLLSLGDWVSRQLRSTSNPISLGGPHGDHDLCVGHSWPSRVSLDWSGLVQHLTTRWINARPVASPGSERC